jgi:hypothetical protein
MLKKAHLQLELEKWKKWNLKDDFIKHIPEVKVSQEKNKLKQKMKRKKLIRENTTGVFSKKKFCNIFNLIYKIYNHRFFQIPRNGVRVNSESEKLII